MTDPTPSPTPDPALAPPPTPAPPADPTPTPQYLVNENGEFAQGWTDKLPEEMGATRGSFGKFKTVGDMAKSYHHLESKLGKHANAIYVPGEGATPEEVSAYREKMGIPSDFNGYMDIKPSEIPEGVEFDPAIAEPYYKVAAEMGIPKAAMAKLVDLQVQGEKARVEEITRQHEANLAAAKEELKKTWGGDFEKNIDTAKKMGALLKLDIEGNQFYSNPEAVKLLHAASTLISEDKWQSGTTTNSPSMDAQDIMTNPQNPLNARYLKGDPTVRAQVHSLLEREAKR